MRLVTVLFALSFSAVALAQAPRVGLLTDEGLNTATIHRTVYYGTCPGLYESPVEAFFLSETTPAAAGRRVTVRNVSFGMDNNPYPYTDRGYTNGRSEHTYLAIGTKHRTRTFSMTSGENELEYTVFENGQPLEQGRFLMQIQLEERRIPRNEICNWQDRCFPNPNGGWSCTHEWVCRCP